MGIKLKDIKILWGRSGGRCAICWERLSIDAKTATKSFPLGEQAHIVGEKDDSPRGDSVLTLEERNSYSNLILLCPNHHTEIDKNVEDYPVEKLHKIKDNHERRVDTSLANDQDPKLEAEALLVSHLVDLAVEACQFETWNYWTSWAVGVHPRWSKDAPERIEEFAKQVAAAVWPQENYEELRRALTTLAHTAHWAIKVFMKHAAEKEEHYFGPMFFKSAGQFGSPGERAALKEWEDWIEDCENLVIQATKAANWVADVVRRDVNPQFFLTEGRFTVTNGPDVNLTYSTAVFEFSHEEREHMPQAFFDRVKETNGFGTRLALPLG